jgi:replicative DNA helicase
LSETKSLPHNLDAEAAVLGGILLHPGEVANRVSGLLQPEDFYSPAHQEIFSAILELDKVQWPIDITSLAEQLREWDKLTVVGGVEALVELSGRGDTAESVVVNARIVREKSTLRRLIRTSAELVSGAEASSVA